VTRAFCTIVSSNYLPQAEVLINSFKLHHPDDQFHLLLLDVCEVESSITEGVRCWIPEEIGLRLEDLQRMRKVYDVVELATSLKPFMLQHLLQTGASEVTYLDPDIKIYSHIDTSINTRDGSVISLTPHRLTPPSLHSLRSLEKVFLKYGSFNLGFISVGDLDKSASFLRWWQEHLLTDSTRRPISEVFTDQKWIDLVPSYFAYSKVRDYGFNVAPWNLDERTLSYSSGELTVNSTEKLKFVHFSQISGMLATGELSREWQSKMSSSGMTSETHSVFLELIETYSAELKESARSSKLIRNYKLLNKPYTNSNYIWRDHLRNKHLGNPYRNSKVNQVLFFVTNSMLKKLTRWDTFNGLIWGLKNDLRRLKKRVDSV
jgi:hypothetical protein